MPDVSPYGVTQNADAARITANALTGEVRGSSTVNAVIGGPATFSTAPYIPPGRGTGSRTNQCIGKGGMCRAYPILGTDRCVFHTSKEPGESPTAP